MKFEWDPEKGKTNKQKHGISFEEAQSVFYDENGRYMADPDDEGEERFILLGLNSMANTLVVCHCYRQAGEVIRIISARKATKNEEAQYWERIR